MCIQPPYFKFIGNEVKCFQQKLGMLSEWCYGVMMFQAVAVDLEILVLAMGVEGDYLLNF